MSLLKVIFILSAAVLIFLFEWSNIDKDQKRERRAFIILLIGGVTTGIVLVYFPDLPSPTFLVELFFKPLSNILAG
ncbi:hypothetical protein ACFO3D_18155 [Virgibacillus kekensis]|uniref:Uncharacterized protein n=1 Tax=Virgibacillus kekensis TaxID=202261 RepID=A0ABV9DMH0_9BACI